MFGFQDQEAGELIEVLSDQLVGSAQAVLAVIKELRSQTLLKDAAEQVWHPNAIAAAVSAACLRVLLLADMSAKLVYCWLRPYALAVSTSATELGHRTTNWC